MLRFPVSFALVPLVAASALRSDEPPVDPETLVRLVVKSQRRAEERLNSYTFDQRVIETKFARNGRPKETERRLYYVLSGDKGEEGSRELIEVDGRLATPEEKKKAVEQDEKDRKKRLERRAAEKAEEARHPKGDDEDPLVGTRRLSALLSRFDYTVLPEEILDGRPAYVVDFRPRPEIGTANLGERALSALAGRAYIDASDFEVVRVDAHLVKPVSVAGGIAAKVASADIRYEAMPVGHGLWFPCLVDVRLRGKTLLFLRLDTAYRYELSRFGTFEVETESTLTPVESKP